MSNRLFVGTRKGLFTVDRKRAASGPRWSITQVSFLGVPIPMALFDPRTEFTYAVLDHGHFGTKVHRSKDGGKGWEEIPAPVYPAPGPGEEAFDTMRQKTIAMKLEKIWALETGHESEPGLLWCGTIPGGLFRSKDDGASWELVRPLWDNPKRKQWFGGGADLPGIHSICVHPQNGKDVTVGVSCGGVWITKDGGETWDLRATGMRAAYMPPEMVNEPNIQDPHRVAQCRAQPQCLWAQHHNGIFRSTDGAASWQEIMDVKPSTFGFPVVVHPQDPDTAWFVPGESDQMRIPVDGKVVVTRTRDGGKSFQILSKGLPQEHSYDITFRHAMDIDKSGDTLAFGSTTGSVWISENQGDSWTCLSEHLPPVYCVRFVK